MAGSRAAARVLERQTSAALTRRRLRNLGCTAENIRAIFCAPSKRKASVELLRLLTVDITFATMTAIRTRLLQMLQVEAAFWCRVIRRRWWEGTVACVAERL